MYKNKTTQKVKSLCSTLVLSTALSASIVISTAFAQDPLSNALNTQQKTDKASQRSQAKVNTLSDQTQELLQSTKAPFDRWKH